MVLASDGEPAGCGAGNTAEAVGEIAKRGLENTPAACSVYFHLPDARRVEKGSAFGETLIGSIPHLVTQAAVHNLLDRVADGVTHRVEVECDVLA